MEEQVFLLLGSNEGDRLTNLHVVKDAIKKSVGMIVEESAIYQSAAWGKTDQPDFYNQVLMMQTTMSPEVLLLQLQQIEKELGRERKEKWGARIIDIDILYFRKTVLNTPDLLIPHPAIALRRFTLVPLVEIAPHFVHPVLKKTNLVLLQECLDVLAVKRVD
ncbi:MAG: 2-amino-4-hydroxy-6-hydroxymethyldihydropteridine diphosphokinase [Flammeovirgaceae bacterium]